VTVSLKEINDASFKGNFGANHGEINLLLSYDV
jgi:hypothetical protein